MWATLIGRGWLRRAIEIVLPDGAHVVEYDGTGFGYEQVLVDGVAIREASWCWYVPRFEFKVGGWPGVVEVHVWPWLAIRALTLSVGGRVVYGEGTAASDQKHSGLARDWDELA